MREAEWANIQPNLNLNILLYHACPTTHLRPKVVIGQGGWALGSLLLLLLAGAPLLAIRLVLSVALSAPCAPSSEIQAWRSVRQIWRGRD